ncbi:MAG: hypothetical protein JWR72_13 [Flavisolibacter sp.]|jgi:uncharacterized protein (TIGR02271 family)|nr:hypothetical protein [Flavisolibacter sp.]
MATDSNQRHTRLQKLGGSDYEIADGQSDIRGWDVKDENGRQIGEVEELIFDEQSRKVRYIVLDLEDNELDLEDREVLVPIGIAQLDKDDDDVLLPGITAEQLRALPEYDEDRFDTDSEESVRNVFGGLGAGALAGGSGADFYNHDHFNEDNLYRNRQQRDRNDSDESTTIPVIKEELEVGKREVENGGIRLRTRVVADQVSEDINLRQEHVNIERTAVDRAATESDLREEEIEMRERNEVPVVNKEARVVEEISLNKEVSERDETISDTVRNTEVDIDRDEDRIRLDRNKADD